MRIERLLRPGAGLPGTAGIWVAAAVLLGTFFRVWRIDQLGEFDFDEVASVWYARQGADEIFRSIADAPFEHPPLYYVLLHYWNQAFGEVEPLVRLFSVPSGVLMIPVTYVLGARLFNRTAGIAAAFIVAASPQLIFYSREARMYSIATLFGLLALYLFVCAVEDGRFRLWLGLAVILVVGVYLDYSVLLALAAMDIHLLFTWRRQRRAAAYVLGVQAVLAAVLLPWLLTSQGVASSLPAWATGELSPGLLSHTAKLGWLEMTVGLEGIRGGRASVLIAILLGGVAAIGYLAAIAQKKAGILLGYVVAVAASLIFLLLFDKEYQPRYLMMGIPPLALFAGYAVSRPPVPRTLMILGVLVLFAAGPLYASRFYYLEYRRGDYRAITAAIDELALPAPEQLDPLKYRDAVVLAGPWQGWYWRHYFPEFEDQVDVWFLPDEVPPEVTWEEVDEKLTRAARNHRRLWVVLSALKQSDPNGYVERWLNVNLWRARDAAYRNGILQLYLTEEGGVVLRDDGALKSPDGPRIEVIEFDGFRADQPPQEAGDGVRFTFHLVADDVADYDFRIRVWLENGQGVVYERTFVPLAVDGRRPSQWTDGERAVGRIAVWVPAGAPTGRYDAYMSVLDRNGVPVTLEGDLWGVFQDEPGIIRIGPVLVEESSFGLPDDAEIFAEFGGPLHDR
jgi:hypothetical protein